MTPKELLLTAAEIIRRHGLHKGAFAPKGSGAWNLYKRYDGPCCIVGALRVAAHGNVHMPLYDEKNGDPYGVARATLEEVIGEFPPSWSDRESTTAEDAIAMLEKAATNGGASLTGNRSFSARCAACTTAVRSTTGSSRLNSNAYEQGKQAGRGIGQRTAIGTASGVRLLGR